jgi:hypothetical protein
MRDMKFARSDIDACCPLNPSPPGSRSRNPDERIVLSLDWHEFPSGFADGQYLSRHLLRFSMKHDLKTIGE